MLILQSICMEYLFIYLCFLWFISVVLCIFQCAIFLPQKLNFFLGILFHLCKHVQSRSLILFLTWHPIALGPQQAQVIQSRRSCSHWPPRWKHVEDLSMLTFHCIVLVELIIWVNIVMFFLTILTKRRFLFLNLNLRTGASSVALWVSLPLAVPAS